MGFWNFTAFMRCESVFIKASREGKRRWAVSSTVWLHWFLFTRWVIVQFSVISPPSPSASLCAEVAVGVGPLQQLLPAVAGRGFVRENHLAVPLLPAAGPHRLPQRADRLPGGAARHMWVTTGLTRDCSRAENKTLRGKIPFLVEHRWNFVSPDTKAGTVLRLLSQKSQCWSPNVFIM